jgi:hypothetical protein
MKPLVIYSSDDNPDYVEFSLIVKEFWEELGFETHYAKIGSKQYPLIPGVNSSLQSQIVRLYAPKYFPNRIILTTDIDMLPFNKKYYMEKLPTSKNQITIFCADSFEGKRYPMCYLSAYGKTFEEIAVEKDETWEQFVHRLNDLNLGWNTDELYMTERINNSSFEKIKYSRGWLPNGVAKNRICRVFWAWQEGITYYDAHCPRPYSKHKEEIDSLRYFLDSTYE